MEKYTISLSFTCSEDLSKMVIADKGRHCMACNKIVVDFTNMKDEDIVNYLLKYKNTCGQFYANQLNKPIVILNKPKRTNWPAVAAMLVAGLVSVVTTNVNANSIRNPNIVYSQSSEVEPSKTDKYIFTIRLLKSNTNTPIYNGKIYIKNVGSFYNDGMGNIVIEINKKSITKEVWVEISASGYKSNEFFFSTAYFKNNTNADIYLDEFKINKNTQTPQLAGKVSIERH